MSKKNSRPGSPCSVSTVPSVTVTRVPKLAISLSSFLLHADSSGTECNISMTSLGAPRAIRR